MGTETNIDIEDIKKKVAKLLSLSESDNEHEANLAMLQANKLLAKYNLEMSDISLEEPDLIEDSLFKSSKKWERRIAAVIAELNFCSTMLVTYSTGSVQIVFVGTKDNVEVTKIMFKKIRSHFLQKSKYYHPRLRDSYLMGVSISIIGTVTEVLSKRKQPDNTEEKGLLVIQNRSNEYVEQLTKGRMRRSRQSTVIKEAYLKGQRDGLQAPIFDEIKR
ncbi:DUF2786 domain-containing protein [Spirochaeta cellobiosiphila]|uniref:DUF2786 domain-containing protein n=1 Tax=Spirochaeta cellobiosiphila TaxID=504483 RepID=UPI0004093F3E|nr:DUF2786 domain-containing protein [Spirochaeta cellobiosiphila]